MQLRIAIPQSIKQMGLVNSVLQTLETAAAGALHLPRQSAEASRIPGIPTAGCRHRPVPNGLAWRSDAYIGPVPS